MNYVYFPFYFSQLTKLTIVTSARKRTKTQFVTKRRGALYHDVEKEHSTIKYFTAVDKPYP